MIKIINFLKTHLIIPILIFLFSFIIVYTELNKNKKTDIKIVSTPQMYNTETATFKGIKTGVTYNEEETTSILGSPVNTTFNRNGSIIEFGTSNEYRNNEIVTENNTIKIIKEKVNLEDNKKTDSITNIYGKAPYRLYEKSPNSVFDLYVYPTNGIAYLGHEDGTLLEIWYFEPIDVNSFISSYASNYSLEKLNTKSSY